MTKNEPYQEIIRDGESLYDLLDSDWEGYDDFEEVQYEAGANYE